MQVFKAIRSMAVISAFAATVLSAHAQEGGSPPSLSLELNGVEPAGNGCRLTFVAANRLGTDIERAAYEVALFGKDGLVKRLTVLDFKALPDGQTKVRQFDLPDTACEGLGRVLLNGVTACEGAPEGACMERLETATRSDVAFGT
ncbi:hypothetical protein [Chelativorans intermedius]|uniref:Tat pathway signal sequence domain protein n=1 Tax=Chelativorans intermedius TaxID=515947 RepID=A0ABV6D424_9HYPH|nr:hypothetical protein [Chelativorans intermedius]MCT8997062.1 hypothetical protein [Chelativorans intermedius]